MPALNKTRRAAKLRLLLWDFSQRGWRRLLNALVAGLGVSMVVYSLLLPWQSLVGGVAVLATAGCFGIAVRRGLIGWPTCGIAAAGWLGLCGLAGSASLLLGSLEPASLVLMAGLLALPLAPWAAAPLALSWNRHR